MLVVTVTGPNIDEPLYLVYLRLNYHPNSFFKYDERGNRNKRDIMLACKIWKKYDKKDDVII